MKALLQIGMGQFMPMTLLKHHIAVMSMWC